MILKSREICFVAAALAEGNFNCHIWAFEAFLGDVGDFLRLTSFNVLKIKTSKILISIKIFKISN